MTKNVIFVCHRQLCLCAVFGLKNRKGLPVAASLYLFF